MAELLLEMPWFSLRPEIRLPTTTGRVVSVDFIDPRMEDMVKNGFIRPADTRKWVAALPNSDMYLTSDGEVIEDPQERITQGYVGLPEQWWEFALGMFRDRVVKAARYPRDWQGEQTQEELDRQAPPGMASGESLERALSRIFG